MHSVIIVTYGTTVLGFSFILLTVIMYEVVPVSLFLCI